MIQCPPHARSRSGDRRDVFTCSAPGDEGDHKRNQREITQITIVNEIFTNQFKFFIELTFRDMPKTQSHRNKQARVSFMSFRVLCVVPKIYSEIEGEMPGE